MTLAIFGERQSGQDVRSANALLCLIPISITAALQQHPFTYRSSLGPHGLDKMLVDDIGDVIVTNDGATILKQLEVQHPAAKVLVELSDLQDKEVGDGTTSVVLLASELLRLSMQLIKDDLHPTAVISGYRLAMKECVRYLKSHLSVDMSKLVAADLVLSVAKTSLASKFIGAEEEFFSRLCVTAIQSVKTVTERGEVRYPVEAISILKTHGKSTRDSELVDGFALKTSRAAQGMPMVVKDAKIALLDFGLRQHRMQLGVSIQVNDPQALEKIRQQEKDIARQRVKQVLQSGANVIITTQGIDDMCLKYFVEAGALAVRRVSKKDIRRIAKATGGIAAAAAAAAATAAAAAETATAGVSEARGTVCLTMATLEGDEVFDVSALGTCAQVSEERVGDWDYLFFTGCKAAKAATIILRGANEYMLDEVERSLHDALCAVSRCMSSSSVCPGGGAVEAALSVYLEDFARTLGSREQLAVAAFAEALLTIPRTLALNAALDASELVARLRAVHAKQQCGGGEAAAAAKSASPAEVKDLQGLDLVNGKLCSSLEKGIVEATISKTKSLKFATEAAVTILRIDDFIRLAPEPERKERD
ncbi:TCP-1/cpn60 family chaperonin, putative [Eimeria acervulina]|uniref:TCP-1/cpn60 family chaperonin, putative n=1 Tax=Eimeria acervulina TaxID=5801 RepID=U6GFP0_EIMAC|nr:TCP-1/cpn60 family chaperonin, putative [Eimeria acervulina]CDI78392.1 TCP-1/cpn60 family chaperonin, putative [Eimeria acervulina]